jgi:hypothetical protein
MRAFVNGGDVAAQFARPSAGAAFEESAPGPGESWCGAHGLRPRCFLPLLPRPSSTPARDWTADAGGAAEGVEASERAEAADGGVRPAGASRLLPAGVLHRFQFERVSLLASSPVLLRELEQWAWMQGRWVIADVADKTKSSDFLHILTKADELSARLNTFAAELRQRPGLPVSQTLRQEMTQLLLRFTTVLARFMAGLVDICLGMPGLRDLHPELAIIGRIYANDSTSLPGFLKSIEDQIATQRLTELSPRRKDCARGLLLQGVFCVLR